MFEDQLIVGREKELQKFNQFLSGKRPGVRRKNRRCHLLLLVGEAGIGKWSLLTKMAKRASSCGNFVFCRKIYCIDRIENYISELTTMIQFVKPGKIGALSDWKKLGFIVGKAILPQIGAVESLLDLYDDVKKEYEDSNNSPVFLANQFCTACSKLQNKIEKNQKIIILLYPQSASNQKAPPWVMPFLELLYHNELASKVYIVLAQKPKDDIISAVSGWESEALVRICAKPLHIGQMNRRDSLSLINTLDQNQKLNSKTREQFLDRYGGWPHLMKLAWEELQYEESITTESINRLPIHIEKHWERKFLKVKGEDQTGFLYTSNLIPHPYSMGDVADFAKINPENLELACRLDCPVWGLLAREDYYDQFLRKTYEDCPTPKHITEKEYILNYLKNSWMSIYKKRMKYIGECYEKIMEDNFNEKNILSDASRYILSYFTEAESWENVKKLVTNIQYLRMRREPCQEYMFQQDFIRLLKKCPLDILNSILLTIENALGVSKEKADWLDTFSYWINEFGVQNEGDESRAAELKKIANKFDASCGKVSKELANRYFKKGGAANYRWGLRFAELYTWVCQRSGNYAECIHACEFASELMSKTNDEAYLYLGKSEFLRMKHLSLKNLLKLNIPKSKQSISNQIRTTQAELSNLFPKKETDQDWPLIPNWEEIADIFDKKHKMLIGPTTKTGHPLFIARVISNIDDCISAIEVINFLVKKGGRVEWIHHQKADFDFSRRSKALLVVFIGGPKAPGISKTAHRFLKYSKNNRSEFMKMYSGLYCEEKILKAKTKGTHLFMLGGISKINTIKAAYDFTKKSIVDEIIESHYSKLKLP